MSKIISDLSAFLGQAGQVLQERRCASCLCPYIPQHAASHLESCICPQCVARLARPHSICPRCGIPLEGDVTHLCPRCLITPPPWQEFTCYGLYADFIKELILRYKFGHDWALGPVLAELLLIAIKDIAPCEALVPMMSHPRRLYARGYNQIMEIAKFVSKQLSIPIQAQWLSRTRNIAPQESLSAKLRADNPKNSFTADSEVAGKRILLIDDVFTTGATLRHAAQCLCDAGACHVAVAVIARTPRQ